MDDDCSPTTDEELKRRRIRELVIDFHDVDKVDEHKALFEACTFSLVAWRQILYHKSMWNLTARLPEVNAPTLIVAGSSDILCSPKQGERIHLAIKRSKLIVIEQAGHYPWIEQPRRFFATVKQELGAFGIAVKSPTTES